MLKNINLNFYNVFSDEPPFSDYPLCIIKRQTAGFLGQNVAEKHHYCV